MGSIAKRQAGIKNVIKLGSDMLVTRLGFGAMRLTGPGIWGEPLDRLDALKVLQRSVELGVSFIDTADSYGPYVNESLIADALHPYPEGLIIGTKGGLARPGPNSWTNEASPAQLRLACEGSLRRLRIDRIDLYQLHAPDPRVPLEASLETLAELQRVGKIRHIGISNVNTDELNRARQIVDIVSVQNRYNLADRKSNDVLQVCERDGLIFIPWYPLAAGKHASLEQLPAGVVHVAKRHGATAAQVAIAWLLEQSCAMLPIPGTSSVAHLEENMGSATLELTTRDLLELA